MKQLYSIFWVLFSSAIAVLLFLFSVEMLLRHTTLLDQLNNNSPSYIPKYLSDQDKVIQSDGYIDNQKFRSWMNVPSLLEDLKSFDGCKVVVLGDSFVWGDGLSVKDTWPAKLSRLTKCRVYPMGHNGSTTYEQFDYYDQYLSNLEFDYLLIGVVANDPHPRGKFRNLAFKNEDYVRKDLTSGLIKFLDFVPNDYISKIYYSSLLGGVFNSFKESEGDYENPPITSYGYYKWRDRLYQEDIFSIWSQAIVTFNKNNRHKPCFIITPTSNTESDLSINKKIEESFLVNKINHINTFSTSFGDGLRLRSEWANPADGHPGIQQTSRIAEAAYKAMSECY